MNIERAARYQHPEFDWQTVDGTLSGTHDGIQITIRDTGDTYALAGRFNDSTVRENATTQPEAIEAIPRLISVLIS